MGRDYDEGAARTRAQIHTRAREHTQQLSLVFRGKTDPTRTWWVFGSWANIGGRKGGGILMQMTEGEGKEERREGFQVEFICFSLPLKSTRFLPLLHSLSR